MRMVGQVPGVHVPYLPQLPWGPVSSREAIGWMTVQGLGATLLGTLFPQRAAL